MLQRRTMTGDELARYGIESATPRGDQVRADLELRSVARQARYALSAEMLAEYGRFIGGLAPWNYFVTLTHDPRRLAPHLFSRARHDPHARRLVHDEVALVGQQRHRRQVKAWVRYDLQKIAPGARWWSETEEHASGQAHEHGLLDLPPGAPLLSIRQRWFERCGYALIVPVPSVAAAAEYVAKYTGKAQAAEPIVAGFGSLMGGDQCCGRKHPGLTCWGVPTEVGR